MKLTRIASSYLVLSIAAFLLFPSCNPTTLTDVTEEVKDEQWNISDTLETTFEVTDTTRYLNIFVTARITPDFPFSNLYVFSQLTGPDKVSVDLVKSFEITSKSGAWLGGGLGDLHDYSLPLLPKYTPKMKGTYTLKVVQYMRQDILPGVHDRGIRVERGEEIF